VSRLGLRFHLQRRLLSPRLRRIRLLVCDVDGVLTDGGSGISKVVSKVRVR